VKKKAKTKKVAPDPRNPQYSGPNSEEFWNRVNALPECGPLTRGELYTAGVLLQNMEGTVLNWLAMAEDMARHQQRSK